MPEPKPAKTVVVDEGVSDDNVLRFSYQGGMLAQPEIHGTDEVAA